MNETYFPLLCLCLDALCALCSKPRQAWAGEFLAVTIKVPQNSASRLTTSCPPTSSVRTACSVSPPCALEDSWPPRTLANGTNPYIPQRIGRQGLKRVRAGTLSGLLSNPPSVIAPMHMQLFQSDPCLPRRNLRLEWHATRITAFPSEGKVSPLVLKTTFTHSGMFCSRTPSMQAQWQPLAVFDTKFGRQNAWVRPPTNKT